MQNNFGWDQAFNGSLTTDSGRNLTATCKKEEPAGPVRLIAGKLFRLVYWYQNTTASGNKNKRIFSHLGSGRRWYNECLETDITALAGDAITSMQIDRDVSQKTTGIARLSTVENKLLVDTGVGGDDKLVKETPYDTKLKVDGPTDLADMTGSVLMTDGD